jgi:hypothetical protein
MNLLYSTPTVACFANDNDALIPELWAQEGLAILEENMVMARLVHRDFSNEIANFGDVVNTRRPSEFTTRRKTDSDDVDNQDAVATNVQVPLDQHVYVSFTIKDGEATKSFQDLVDIYLQPAAMQVARTIDRILLGQTPRFLTNNVGSLMEMSSSNAKNYILDCREKMNVNKAYAGGRNLVLSPQSETEMLKTELFIAANQRGDDGSALEEARLGRLLGFDTYMDQNTPAITKSVTVDYQDGLVDAAEVIGETESIAITLSTNYVATVGEFIWFEGEGKPHVITVAASDANTTNSVNIAEGLSVATTLNAVCTIFKACDTGVNYAAGYAKGIVLTNYTATKPPVTGQLLAFGTGTTRHTYTIIEAYTDGSDYTIYLDRPLDTAVTLGANVAFPGPSGAMNLAFHRNALALVSRPLALPNTALGVRASVGVFNDIAMRASMQYNITSQGTIVTLDLLCGVAVLDTDLACVLLG